MRFGEELTPDDLSHFYSASVLVRTEIATLIGLLARQPIDFTLPEPSVLQHYLDRAQDLLRELHQALVPTIHRTVGEFEIYGASIPSGEVGGEDRGSPR